MQGDFKFETEGVGSSREARESIDAAFRDFDTNANRVAMGMHASEKDYLLFFNDLQKKGSSAECSLAEFVGLCSAACNRPVLASLVIPGVLRMSGTLEELTGLEDIFRVAKNAGAKRILLPFSCIADLQSMPGELMGSVSPVFYDGEDPVSAAKKALDLS